MRLFRPRLWLGYLLALAGLIFVVAGWLFVTIGGEAARRTRLRFTSSLRRSSLFLSRTWKAIVVGSPLVVGLLVVSASPPLGLVALVVMAVFGYLFFQVPRDRQDGGPIAELSPSVSSTTGLSSGSWLSSEGPRQVDFKVYSPGLRGFGDRDLVREHVAGLVEDWLSANGWKYRLVGVWLPGPKSVSPFGAVAEWWKVYQIALEDPRGLVEYGWIRFGDGKVAFQFDAKSSHQTLRVDPAEVGKSGPDFPPEPMPVMVGPDPLWDRSLDG